MCTRDSSYATTGLSSNVCFTCAGALSGTDVLRKVVASNGMVLDKVSRHRVTTEHKKASCCTTEHVSVSRGVTTWLGRLGSRLARCRPWVVLVLALISVPPGQAYVNPEVREYCQFESFNATCGDGHIVIIDSARYGRMGTGRCATMDFARKTCSDDVRSYIESLCSGRKSCKFEIPDDTLKNLRPCPKDFANYLAASYHCVPVQTGEGSSCYRAGRLEVPATPSGYLASTVTEQSGRGSSECPWSVRARPGQRINITLLDFMASVTHSHNDVIGNGQGQGHSYCPKYASITETSQGTTHRRTEICGGDGREKSVYISATNHVNIEIQKYSSPKKLVYFMLHYKAIGCADYPTPKNGWMYRNNDETYIGCNDTDHKYKLTCVGSGWVGEAHNCTLQSESAENVWTLLSDDWSSPFGILIVSAMGILLGLVIGAALLAVVLVFVRRNKSNCLGTASDYVETPQEVEEPPGGNYVIQNKRNSVTALMDQYEMSQIADNYGATWRAHTPSCTQGGEHDVTTTRFVTPIVTCSASIADSNGSPCRAPDVTCVVRKGQSLGRGMDGPHMYEAPFIGRDLQLHTITSRDG